MSCSYHNVQNLLLVEIVAYLVQKCNMRLEITDQGGNTALQLACKAGCFEVVQFLVEECRANIATYNLIHTACELGHMEIANYLVKRGNFDIEATTNVERHTALIFLLLGGLVV